MYKDSIACKEKNEAYYARQKMLEEKAKAKKAMKQAGESAPSILVEDEEQSSENQEADSDDKESDDKQEVEDKDSVTPEETPNPDEETEEADENEDKSQEE